MLRSITNKLEDDNEPDDDKQHRSVGVDPDFYDMVDDNIISILLDACKPLFELVSSSSSPDSKPSAMKPADLLMTTAKLIIAAGFKMKEQARQEMAEEDLGGGMFDQDVRDMRAFAAKVPLPQVYDPDEQMVLDTQLALHEAPGKAMRKYKTGTKLYTCQLADTGSGVDNRDALNEEILDVIRMTNVLRSAQAKYRFFDEFIFHIIRNAMKRGAVQAKFTVKTHLVALTANEAGRIARSLVSIIMANATAEAAVDEFIMTFPALGELDREYTWFRPMMEAIAAELMSQVAYGVKIFAKAAGTALLAVTNPAWLWYYVLGDHGLHFAYRIARRDFVFFVPAPAAASYAFAPIVRVIFKVLCDFTGTLACRLPLLCGGSYFAWSLASSQVSVFAAAYLYIHFAPIPEGADKVAADTLWVGVTTLAAAWLVTWIFFVFRIAVPKYRHTLWSWTSGRQLVHDYFLKGRDDEAKFTEIFSMNLLLWESDIGEEVKAWVAENWARWKEESPPWFKAEMVPDQFVPAGDLEQLGHNRKRRGSAVGSVRESFREVGGGDEEE
ncbi:hypothetical protein TeGR_g13329 [Tetraparma gracilis]|uniref:Uncharacterized protein n=1 Tax=Tetraparma gracilis TaxID=2962635 RepID=A0ABQ6MHK5_9STRA|nr:hypothetical protein TeGR_g13329 [Tetraparma gracilis]